VSRRVFGPRFVVEAIFLGIYLYGWDRLPPRVHLLSGGPILLGSQTQPWICATPTPVAASGNTPASNASGLTTFAVDAQCNIATEYKLFYRTTTAGCSNALPDPSPPAAPTAPTRWSRRTWSR
jgi:cytochrome bd-type quinol oxidase subunit 1